CSRGLYTWKGSSLDVW
nr:immunoglobulin heavy chain junction region [Macaca mulatta]